MSKIDVSHWKKFKLTDIFNIHTGASIPSRYLEPGKLPRITVTMENNGIIGNYKPVKNKNQRIYSNFISVNFFGGTFYHSQKASVDMKVHVLQTKKDAIPLTTNTGLFIASCLRRHFQIEGYGSYGDQLSSSKLKKEIVILPVTTSGIPDWSYMDTYISTMTQKARFELKELKKPTKESPKLDIKKWKKFKISDIFKLNHGKRIKRIALDIPGKIDYLTAGQENQGVLMSVKKQTLNQQTLNTYKSVITIDMFGNCFYHPETVSGDDNIYFLTNKKISESAKLFITAVLSHKLSDSFGYTNQFRQRYFNKISIPLPVTTSGTPDWHYMDTYISALKHRAQQQIKLTKKMKTS